VVVLAAGVSVVAVLSLVVKRCGHRLRHRRWSRTGATDLPIPRPDAPWLPDLVQYALTFDGVGAFGGLGPLGDYANECRKRWAADGALPEHVAELRACLFFEQRRFQHFGCEPRNADDHYVRALLESIRQKAL
jgi:hypothetical protein